MRFNTLRELKKLKPEQRKKWLLRMRKRNLIFFQNQPETQKFAELMQRRDVEQYEIRFSDAFLDIIEKSSGGYCHPPGQLIQHVKKLSKPYHSDWTDLVKPLQENYGDSQDGRLVRRFVGQMYRDAQDIRLRVLEGKLDLPEMQNRKMHSGPIVFLGIFHGLHLLELLKTIEPSHIMLIEPDIDAFLLSCYFVDYNQLAKKFGMLNLVVGKVTPDYVVEDFISRANISSRAWVRFLKVYHDPVFDEVVAKVSTWFHKFDTFVPLEREIAGLLNQCENLRSKTRYCHEGLDSMACKAVAVVGSGPSLLDDLQWLKQNQQNLIIIAATSTSGKLLEAGIRPDCQVYLELHAMDVLDKRIPTFFFCKSPPELIRQFEYPILFAEGGKPNLVRFNSPLWNTHPSSMNAALSLAGTLKPERIYLLGADAGASSTLSDQHAAHQGNDPSLSSTRVDLSNSFEADRANFPEPGKVIKTNGFLHQVKLSLEKQIGVIAKTAQVFNCSDGVYLIGAEPRRTSDVFLESEEKLTGEQLFGQFPVLNDRHWQRYTRRGQDLFQQWKTEVADLFKEEFVWDQFVQALENRLPQMTGKFFDFQAFDFRLHVFDEVLRKIYAEWYRALIFTKTDEEAHLLYRQGRKAMQEILADLQWPEELDEF